MVLSGDFSRSNGRVECRSDHEDIMNHNNINYLKIRNVFLSKKMGYFNFLPDFRD